MPPSRNSRSSPRLPRPMSIRKRPPSATKAATEWTESPTKPASPRKEHRQTAIQRAVRVYSHSPGVAVSGGCRPRSPRRAGCTSPRGSLPAWNEMRAPAAERRRCTTSEEHRHPLPWPLQEGSFGGQVCMRVLSICCGTPRKEHALSSCATFRSPRHRLLRFSSLYSSWLRQMTTRYLSWPFLPMIG